jgi:hypothetical protein
MVYSGTLTARVTVSGERPIMADSTGRLERMDDRASPKAVWWVVLIGILIPCGVGLLLWPLRGSGAIERGLGAVVFVTVPVVVVGGLGLYGRREVFRTAAVAAYGFMSAAYILVELLAGDRPTDVTMIPVWSAGAAVAAAAVMALLKRAGRPRKP